MADRVYHWKHGWIPLTHTAALSKSKGSEVGARRYLAASHAAGHAHDSVVGGSYGGGTHVRGLQPVSAEHLPRRSSITAAFNPASRRFALHDRTGVSDGKQQPTMTSIPEHLAEHLQSRGHSIWRVRHENDGQHRIVVTMKHGGSKSFAADGSDIRTVDPEAPKISHGQSNEGGARWVKITTEEALGPDTRDEKQKKWDAYTASLQRGRRTTRNSGARERAMEKVKAAYRHQDGHVVLIEPTMSKAKTEQFLNSVHDVIGGASASDVGEPVTFHVPTGDRNFSSGRVLAYVRKGQHAVYVSPKLASGDNEQPKGTTHFMPAHETMSTQRYALAHELGHVIDHRHNHVGGSHGGTSQMTTREKTERSLFAEYRGQLSKYGATTPAEAYAEAYAQWHSGQRNTVADAYAARYGWKR